MCRGECVGECRISSIVKACKTWIDQEMDFDMPIGFAIRAAALKDELAINALLEASYLSAYETGL